MLCRTGLGMFKKSVATRLQRLSPIIMLPPFSQSTPVVEVLQEHAKYTGTVTEFLHKKLAIGYDAIRNFQHKKAHAIFDEIINSLKDSEESTPGSWKLILSEAYANKGSLLLQSGDTKSMQQGEKYLQRALALNPDNELAKEKMDMCLFDRGELPEDRLKF